MLIEHSKKVQARLRRLGEMRTLAFGALCAERQFHVYARAAEGKTWARTDELRAFLDSVWSWLEAGAPRPVVAAEDIPINEENIHDDADSAATEVALSFYGLAACIETEKLDGCLGICESGLTLLESFLFERLELDVTVENEAAIHEHELIRTELKSQLDDLRALRGASEEALSGTLRELRLRASHPNHGLMGSYWFSV